MLPFAAWVGADGCDDEADERMSRPACPVWLQQLRVEVFCFVVELVVSEVFPLQGSVHVTDKLTEQLFPTAEEVLECFSLTGSNA